MDSSTPSCHAGRSGRNYQSTKLSSIANALTDLNFRRTYDPDVFPDPVAEFYSPALFESVAYDRNTFTFTANGLIAAAVGLAGLLRNDGHVRIICEPRELSDEVRQAVIAGHTQALLDAVPPEDLTNITEGDIRAKNQLDIITWLVAQGRLEIRVALPRTAEQGIFHAKTGIMGDSQLATVFPSTAAPMKPRPAGAATTSVFTCSAHGANRNGSRKTRSTSRGSGAIAQPPYTSYPSRKPTPST